eukprot:1141696-Pelagomonas_calceolata.AAC.2
MHREHGARVVSARCKVHSEHSDAYTATAACERPEDNTGSTVWDTRGHSIRCKKAQKETHKSSEEAQHKSHNGEG